MNWLRLALQILLPVLVLAAAWAAIQQVLAAARSPAVIEAPFRGPLVRSALVQVRDLRIEVPAQGTVEPQRSVVLAPQVGGRITAVHPQLRAGGFAAAGEVLVAIDDSDYRLQVTQREAAIAAAELRLQQERAEAAAAVRAWRELEGERPADPLVVRAPQLADAEAALAAAKAQLERARLDLERTRVVAPFAARVRSATAEVGQTVQAGERLAELHGTDAAEVRLPIPAGDAAFLDLPLRPGTAESPGATVELVAEFAGERHTYAARVVRTEAEIDRRSRQLTIVAAIDDPYGLAAAAGRPPLLVGTFVAATIAGRTFPGVAVVPRAAVAADGTVWVVDAEHRLRRRRVQVLRAGADEVLVRDGLTAGERVCVSPLDAPNDGMPVQLLADEPAGAGPGSQPAGGR